MSQKRKQFLTTFFERAILHALKGGGIKGNTVFTMQTTAQTYAMKRSASAALLRLLSLPLKRAGDKRLCVGD